MVWSKKDYDNIPGTYVFDGRMSETSFGLNHMLFSFNEEENRKAFAEDPAAYADKFGLSAEQKEALLKEDFLELLRKGANIYYMAKLAVPNGTSVQDIGAAFQKITTEEFQEKLNEQSSVFQDQIAKIGGYWNG